MNTPCACSPQQGHYFFQDMYFQNLRSSPSLVLFSKLQCNTGFNVASFKVRVACRRRWRSQSRPQSYSDARTPPQRTQRCVCQCATPLQVFGVPCKIFCTFVPVAITAWKAVYTHICNHPLVCSNLCSWSRNFLCSHLFGIPGILLICNEMRDASFSL